MKKRSSLFRRLVFVSGFLCVVIVAVCLWLVVAFQIPVRLIPGHLLRMSASSVLQYVYSEDKLEATRLSAGNYRASGTGQCSGTCLSQEDFVRSGIIFLNQQERGIEFNVPFVYGSPDQATLTRLRHIIDTEANIDRQSDEFQQMLALFGWVGGLWDHGTDTPPGGFSEFDPLDLLRAAAKGGKFWCEVSAKFTVYAATAMGWPARLVSLSRNGYEWEHAVAEVWSNQFSKWFVVDTDFNFIYERDGVPLSAYELCHQGRQLQHDGVLTIQSIAPPKKSIQQVDLIPYYSYVHIDLRSDWLSRDLAKGSPAGGDLSTWWTAREDIGRILTIKTQIEDQNRFDWPVNVVNIKPCRIIKSLEPAATIEMHLQAYSPYFIQYEWQLDDGGWQRSLDDCFAVPAVKGRHRLKVRVLTEQGGRGQPAELTYQVQANLYE